MNLNKRKLNDLYIFDCTRNNTQSDLESILSSISKTNGSILLYEANITGN